MDNKRLIITVFILFILVSSASATTLTITARDEFDDTPVKGASVYVSGSYIGTTDSNGQYIYSHALSDNFRVGIEKDGYEYWNDMISASKTTLVADMIRERGVLTVNVMDGDTLQPISGAVVRVSGTGIETSDSTGADGSAVFEVALGSTYVVEVQKERYESIYRNVEMDEDSKKVDYLLQRSDLVIFQIKEAETGLPLEDVSVYIDDILEGTTGSDGRLTSYIDHERSYDIRISKPDYQSFEENYYFSSDDIIYSVSISKTLYPVAVSVYNSDKVPIDGADIYIDDEYFGRTDDYGRSDVTNLVAGSHKFEVRKSGYSDWIETILIDGEGDNIIATPEYIKADVTIFVEDKSHNPILGAVVVLDGKTIGSTNSQGIVTTELLTNSKYIFSVTKDGYKDLTETRSIPLGSTEMTITLTMESSFNVALAGGIVLLIVIAGIAVYILKFSGNRGNKGGGRRGRSPGHREGGSL